MISLHHPDMCEASFVLPLVQAIQRHVAVVAISPSAVRGQGAKGVASAAQTFFGDLPLQPFAVPDGAIFGQLLETTTGNLVEEFPERARSWGLARKCINLFLRDARYNTFLSTEYGLAVADPHYEVPLDGVVAAGLRRLASRNSLPAWLGVKNLTPQASEKYQRYALQLSTEWGIARVHLDAYLWVEGR